MASEEDQYAIAVNKDKNIHRQYLLVGSKKSDTLGNSVALLFLLFLKFKFIYFN